MLTKIEAKYPATGVHTVESSKLIEEDKGILGLGSRFNQPIRSKVEENKSLFKKYLSTREKVGEFYHDTAVSVRQYIYDNQQTVTVLGSASFIQACNLIVCRVNSYQEQGVVPLGSEAWMNNTNITCCPCGSNTSVVSPAPMNTP